MPPELNYDLAQIDLTRVIADKAEILRTLPQQFEMSQLDGVIHMDPTIHLAIGFKDVKADEFWTRGHMPGYPLLPGVLMCEAGAQLGSFYVMKNNLLHGEFLGFGGMSDIRFRGPVHPGDRLLLVCIGTKITRRKMLFNVQGFVGDKMVFNGDIMGVPLSRGQGERA